MNRKRYQKKMYAMLARAMKGNPDIGKILKNVQRAKMTNGTWQNENPAPYSYSESWAMFEPTRKMFGMK